ncbi:hypothetical protein NE865_09953 [Phthorimaea operculella]|nr:hypothetical protein NE865_09953 [Phthorimaea operculella]
MSTKCSVCKKGVTKRSPALTCSKCDAIVHERKECSDLNNKQRAALRAASSTLEWVCKDCHFSTSRRTSFLDTDIEDDDDESKDEEDEPRIQVDISGLADSPDMKKLLARITKEVEKILKRELQAVIKSAKFASDKVDEFSSVIKTNTEIIKNLQRKQTSLQNENTHLNTKIEALEQRVETAEQAALVNYIEIAGIPPLDKEKENIEMIVKNVGIALQVVDQNNISQAVLAARRLPSRQGKSSAILVQLLNENVKQKWINASRDAGIVLSNIYPELKDVASGSNRVYIREALTPRTKYLLAKAKELLKDSNKFKFVWCKYGKVFARQSENAKIFWIRNEHDMKTLTE